MLLLNLDKVTVPIKLRRLLALMEFCLLLKALTSNAPKQNVATFHLETLTMLIFQLSVQQTVLAIFRAAMA